ncbi:hypothetical protein [Flavobacterium rhizosphaerae]|uniref:Lipoprotein n=1 Tax=Flavobacterium rhizosphaerae TaxID=3163298 RepID=A0ABW8YRZ5_9FLAO
MKFQKGKVDSIGTVVKVVLLLLLLSFLTSCSKKLAPTAAYSMLEKRELTKSLGYGSETADNTILPEKAAEFKLAITDSVMAATKQPYTRTNFKELYLKTKPNTKYKITISSLCDCLGSRKYLFKPVLLLYDKNSNLLQCNIEGEDFGYTHGPLSMDRAWVFNTLNTEGDLRLIVFSDNNNLNQSVYKYIVAFAAVEVKSTTNGDFYVLLEEIR